MVYGNGVIFQPKRQTTGLRQRLFFRRIQPASSGSSSADPNLSKLQTLVAQHKAPLLKLKNRSFFALFPTELIADYTKVTVVRKISLLSEQIRSVAYEDIFNVTVSTSVFFATIEIIDKLFPADPLSITHLPKQKASAARRIIQGMMIAKKEGIDVRTVQDEGLVNILEELGRVRST